MSVEIHSDRAAADPPGSRIRLGRRHGLPAIILPRTFVRGGMWKIFAFGVPFIVVPALAGSELHNVVLSLPLILIGFAIVGFGLFFGSTRQVILDDGRAILVEIALFGKPVHTSEVLKDDVQEVAIRAVNESAAGPEDPQAVYVLASAQREFCVGPCLSAEELDWIRGVISGWTRS